MSNFNYLSKTLKDMETLNEYFNEGMDKTNKILRDIMERDTESKGRQESLKVTMMEFIRMQKNLEKYISGINDVKLRLENNATDENVSVDEMIKSVQNVNDSLSEKQILRHPKMKDFNRILKAATDDGSDVNLVAEDDDMIMTQADLVTTDPITKKQMVNPVTNKICKHNYDKQSIIHYMKTKKRAKCPHAGCPNQVPLKEDDLEINMLLKREIDRRNRE